MKGGQRGSRLPGKHLTVPGVDTLGQRGSEESGLQAFGGLIVDISFIIPVQSESQPLVHS